jgi:hypothetical protein
MHEEVKTRVLSDLSSDTWLTASPDEASRRSFPSLG